MYKTLGEYTQEYRDKGIHVNEARRYAELEVLEDHAMESCDAAHLREVVTDLIRWLKPKV